MAALKDAVAWLARQHLAGESLTGDGQGRWLNEQFQSVLRRPELRMVSELWAVTPEELAVKVLKAAGQRVPNDWLSNDKATGRFKTREDLLGTVWLMASGKRLVSEIARNVELPPAAVKAILLTGEGRPAGLELKPHHRGRVRRGLVAI